MKTRKPSRRGIPSRVLQAIDTHDTEKLAKLRVSGSYSVTGTVEFFTGCLANGRRVFCETLQLQLLLVVPSPDTAAFAILEDNAVLATVFCAACSGICRQHGEQSAKRRTLLQRQDGGRVSAETMRAIRALLPELARITRYDARRADEAPGYVLRAREFHARLLSLPKRSEEVQP
jgi:hypothetical protein